MSTPPPTWLATLHKVAEGAPWGKVTRETLLGVACHSQSLLADCSFIHSIKKPQPPTCIRPTQPSSPCLKPTSPPVHSDTFLFTFSRASHSASLPPGFSGLSLPPGSFPSTHKHAVTASILKNHHHHCLLVHHSHPVRSPFLFSLLIKCFRRVPILPSLGSAVVRFSPPPSTRRVPAKVTGDPTF